MSKTLALVAHDTRKKDLMEWAAAHAEKLLAHDLVCTGTMGRLLAEIPGPAAMVRRLKSGLLRGEQQLEQQALIEKQNSAAYRVSEAYQYGKFANSTNQ